MSDELTCGHSCHHESFLLYDMGCPEHNPHFGWTREDYRRQFEEDRERWKEFYRSSVEP